MSQSTTTACNKCGKVTRQVDLEVQPGSENWDVSMHSTDFPITEPGEVRARSFRMEFVSWDFCAVHAAEVHALLTAYAPPSHDTDALS